MWFISFHGGTEKGQLNNIHIYHDDGTPHKNDKLLPQQADYPLRELRAFVLMGQYLYVANGYKKYSQVLRYTMTGKDTCTFDTLYASPAINSIDHPYGIALDGAGNLYVSSQDTNVVTCVAAVQTPAPVCQYLLSTFGSGFDAGTFVGSSVGNLPGTNSATPVPVAQGGLDVSYSDDTDTKVQHSVRGVLYVNGYLYVCDEPGDAVRVYNAATGAVACVLQDANLLGKPVQLAVQDNMLYIGSTGNDSVIRCALPDGLPPVNPVLEYFINGAAKHVSGICFDSAGNFYAADRKANKVNQYDAQGNFTKTVIDNLPDNPEFILWLE